MTTTKLIFTFVGFVALPLGAMALASYQVFEGVKEVEACGSCHVMQSKVFDMKSLDAEGNPLPVQDEECKRGGECKAVKLLDKDGKTVKLRDRNGKVVKDKDDQDVEVEMLVKSRSLAARHYSKGWIADKQCYNCHTDYSFAGSMKAKGDGFRHLARYITGRYEEPIVFRGYYDNNNCLKCHGETEKYLLVPSHHAIAEPLATSQTSCLNCHGPAHADHPIPLSYQE
ncbi:MAG: hypothetical protein FWG75_11070 [Cystobacterineae bacterium]|nr:hypothetical protein [Cystobacterineae bacterium]